MHRSNFGRKGTMVALPRNRTPAPEPQPEPQPQTQMPDSSRAMLRAMDHVISRVEDNMAAQLLMINRIEDSISQIVEAVGVIGKRVNERGTEVNSKLAELRSGILSVGHGLMDHIEAVKGHSEQMAASIKENLNPRGDFDKICKELCKFADVLGNQKSQSKALAALSSTMTISRSENKAATSGLSAVMQAIDELNERVSAIADQKDDDSEVAKAIDGLAATLTNRKFTIDRNSDGEMVGFQTESGTKH